MKTKAEKAAQLEEIRKVFADSKSIVLVNFNGLSVAEDTELRRKVREAETEYTVYKNTLIAIVAKEAGLDLDASLSQNTALCSSAKDAVAACKVISEFAKKHDKLVIKKALAALPPKEVLVAKMLGSLNAPISGLVRTLHGTIAKVVYALDAVRAEKEKQSA